MTGGSHSIRFAASAEPLHIDPPKPPRATKPNGKTPVPKEDQGVPNKVQLAPRPNALNALHGARVQSQIIFDKMKPLVDSENRHGDLQVIRSAALHLIEHIDVLITAEES
jgi:hypothetical protein